MTINAVTGIDVSVDRFAIYQESEQQFTNLNAKWPRLDGGPLEGANPDFRYYKRVNVDRPDVDHRFTITSVSGRVDYETTPPDGHPVGTYEAIHTAVKLPISDLKAQVDTEFQRRVTEAFPTIQNPSLLIEASDAVVRKQNGATLTEDQQSVLDAITASGDVVAQLRARRDALYVAIDANEDYDITDGWPTIS